MAEAAAAADADLTADQLLAALADLLPLAERAGAGDLAALQALRGRLDDRPALWREAGDLGRNAELSWVHHLAGPDLVLRECVLRQLAALKAAWAGAGASPLEQVLVQQVAIAWLECHYLDAQGPALHRAAAAASVSHLRAFQQHRDQAARRLGAAVKQLAVVRQLLAPRVRALDLAGLPPPEAARPQPHRRGGRLASAPAVAN
jgi:hypothetical protein